MTDLFRHLADTASRAATRFGSAAEIGIMLRHHRAVVPVACSGDRAARCDGAAARSGDGPCILALKELHSVLVAAEDGPDVWPEWHRQMAAEGFLSALVMPAYVADHMDVAVTVYSERRDPWDVEQILALDACAQQVAAALHDRLVVPGPDRVLVAAHDGVPSSGEHRSPVAGQHRASVAAQDGVPAGATAHVRTPDRALLAAMRCNSCSLDEALGLLMGAAAHRNVTLEEVADTLLEALPDGDGRG